LRLPQLVNDLSAERVGDRIILRWTTPSRTTDDLEIKGSMTAELCRVTDIIPSTPAVGPTSCAPVRHLPVSPGPSQVDDTLPPALQSDPPLLLTYRIRIFNSTGHSAGDSTTAAYAAAGAAPAPFASLRATASEQGAVLEWKSVVGPAKSSADEIDLRRIDLSTPPRTEKKATPAIQRSGKSSSKSKSAQPRRSEDASPNEVHLRAPDSVASSTRDTVGTVDTTAVMGDIYTYTAQRVRAVTLGSRKLEIASLPSALVTLAMRDTFPPKPPTGLATISGNASPDPAVEGAKPQPYIDLSWEPNTEPDLAGYRVYRQLSRPDGSPQGPLARLTALPIAVPAYRDVAVRPGQGYIYTVTAVDAAGNESAPSAKTLESVSE